ncbi:MAG: hypothetical protein HY689_09830 [Chloroflexi bacterium]|nr:hypothetical protein [Chloroflexota bacterium]
MADVVPPGHRLAWRVRTETVEYVGEILIAPQWHRAFGLLDPQADLAFRLVLLTAPQPVPTEELDDPRVLSWTPLDVSAAPSRAPQEGRVAEPRAAYRVTSTPDLLALLGETPGRFVTGQGEWQPPARTADRDPLYQALTAHLEALERLRQRAAPYREALLSSHVGSGAGDVALAGEQQVAASLEGLREEVARLQAALAAACPDEPGTDYLELEATLRRLATVATAGAAVFPLVALRSYPGPDAFRADLEQCRNLAAQLPVLEGVAAVVTYLRAVQFRPEDELLEVDRRACLLQANPAYVLHAPSLWDSIAQHFREVQAAYQRVYRTVHHRYRREVVALRRRYDALAPDLSALELLNTLEELGPPLGQGLREEYNRLERALAPCTRSEADLDLAAAPTCPECGIPLTAVPPTHDLETLAHDLGRALRQQQRRLSSRAVRQILARSSEPRVIRLVQVARASDLSPLVNVLDETLVTFLRELLRETR